MVTPLVERWILHGKYHLSVAARCGHLQRRGEAVNAFTKGVATALVGPRELSVVNVAGWLSVGLALVGAYVGARWGLAGVIYGVALGWFLRSIISFGVVVRHLRMPAGVPATAP